MFCNQCGMDTGNEAPFCVQCGGRSIGTVSTPTAGAAAAAPARYPVPQLPSKEPGGDLAVWVLLPIVFLGVWCIAAGVRQLQQQPATSQFEQIANAPITLKPDGYYYYKFKVPPEARNAIVQGHFSTAGGIGNEVEAYILRKDDFEGWWNGEHRPTIYQSGKSVQTAIKAQVPAGDVYYLVVSNQVSQTSAKVVWIDVTLTYNL